ncbi:hypothetical protein SELMODRAFT_432393 [Selaginella moellendorffii]|uniref:Uncharacterized protein n=1 Tax=Selaginella moellendorffii TaxID=88036 RepID=D8TFV3_SELML|nr:hypothetical protein SELMODRAFT_432393 [Selaginella moellendorffii]
MTKIFRAIAATAASSLVRDKKTSYQKPQPTFVPYPTPLTPEEVQGTALDNDPKRLKVPAYYNEVVFVSPFAKLCSMISENRLDAFQTYAGKKISGIRLCRCIRQIDVLCSEMRRGLGVKGEEAMVDGAHDRDNVSDNEGIHLPPPGKNLTFLVMFLLREKDIACLSSILLSGRRFLPLESHLFLGIATPALAIIVMGGEDSGNAYLNDVYILDTETMAWQEVKTTGAELMLRAGHTTISHGKYLVVFGGFSYDHKLFNDVRTLDLIFCEEMLREKDPSEPKLSMRKELKRRRQEYRATPFVLDKQRDADKSLVSSHGVSSSCSAARREDVRG